MRRRLDGLIMEGLPAERIGGDQQINHIRFENGADVIMAAIQRPELVNAGLAINPDCRLPMKP